MTNPPVPTSSLPIPRVPTHDEKEAVVEVLTHSTQDADEARRIVEYEAYIAVFDNYMTTSPGYAGKVMFVLLDTSPSFYWLMTFDNEGYPRAVPQRLL